MMKHANDGYVGAFRRAPAHMLSNSGSLSSGSTKPRPNTTPISSIRVVQKGGPLSSSTTRQSASLVKLSPSESDGGAEFHGEGSDRDGEEIIDEVEDCVRLEDDLDTAQSSCVTVVQAPTHSSSIRCSAAPSATASPLAARTPNVRRGQHSDKRHHPVAGDADGYAGDAFEEEEVETALATGGGSPLPVSPRPPGKSPVAAAVAGAKQMPSKRSMSSSSISKQPLTTGAPPARRGSRDPTPLRTAAAPTKASAASKQQSGGGGAPGSKKSKGSTAAALKTRRPLTADVALEVAKTTAQSAAHAVAAAAFPLPIAGFVPGNGAKLPAVPSAVAAVGPSPSSEAPPVTKKLRVQVSHRALIGKGSFGVVYQAMDRDTNHIIACKEVCIVRGSGSGDQVALIKKELALLKQLDHPNIVKCLGEDCDDKYLRIYMEFITGGSISSILRSFGPLQEKQASVFTRQMLEGLKYLHAKNICHRDLKGDNLLVDTQGTLKLADFGAAKELATQTTTIAGTAYFMAPEVIQGVGHGVEADVWSVGCCVVEMLTGHPPFHHLKNQYAIMMYIAEESRSLEEIFPKSVSPSCTAFLKRCLIRSPSKRATVAELLEDPWIVSPPDVSSDGEEAKLLDTGSIQLAGQRSIMEARQNSHITEAEDHLPPQADLGPGRNSPPLPVEPRHPDLGVVAHEHTPTRRDSVGLLEVHSELKYTAATTAPPRSPSEATAQPPHTATHSFNPLDLGDDET